MPLPPAISAQITEMANRINRVGFSPLEEEHTALTRAATAAPDDPSLVAYAHVLVRLFNEGKINGGDETGCLTFLNDLAGSSETLREQIVNEIDRQSLAYYMQGESAEVARSLMSKTIARVTGLTTTPVGGDDSGERTSRTPSSRPTTFGDAMFGEKTFGDVTYDSPDVDYDSPNVTYDGVADDASEERDEDDDPDGVISATTMAIARGTNNALLPQVRDVQRRMRHLTENGDSAGVRDAANVAYHALVTVEHLVAGDIDEKQARPSIKALVVLAVDVAEIGIVLHDPVAGALFKSARLIGTYLLKQLT